MTKEQIKKFKSWLKSKGVTSICPACDSTNMWKAGEIISAPEFKPGVIKMGEKSVPKAQLVCGNCAYVMEFAAAEIGLSR